jgi:hypothetical protein
MVLTHRWASLSYGLSIPYLDDKSLGLCCCGVGKVLQPYGRTTARASVAAG